MYLKRIKIFGFKSFADETIFDFSQGITAIVGPNGCGKSNVLDAFNWVLGEQSATRLRGGNMQDMIFHGSRTRKPIGIASVELCFDNSKDQLPIDYNEVTVIRKLYRSGESEYFINKSLCRLKDIKELFLDTGIGTRAYSVMEQDNIKYILESSPVERRGIVEEAAGIRKYKEKKLEAERRLERIRHDLNEVKNIMGEVQKNIRRLKRQTRRAQIYKNFKQQLKELEVGRLCQEYVKISEQLGGNLKETGGLEEEVVIYVGKKDKYDTEILKLENQKTGLDEKLLSDNRNVYQIESKIEIISDRIENFSSSQKRLEEDISRYKNNYNYNNKRISQLSEELNRLEDAYKHKDKEIENQYEELEGQYAKIKREQKKLCEEIAEVMRKTEHGEEELFKLRHKEIDIKNQGEVSEKRLKELQDKKTVLEESSDNLKKEIDQKAKSLSGLESQLVSHNTKITGLQEELKDINTKIDKAGAERESLLTEYHSKKSQFDSGKKYLPQLVSIEKLAHKKISGIKGTISSVFEEKLTENDIKELSKILGEKVGWILSENKKSAIEAIEYLRNENLPPLTFILMDHISEVEVEVDYEIPSTISSEVKNIIKYFIKSLKIDTDMVWHGDCIISGGGENPPRVQRIMGLEREIEHIKENLKKSEIYSNEIKGKKKEILNSIENFINKRNSLQNDLSSLKEQIGQLTGNLEYTDNELEIISDKLLKISPRDELEKNLVNISEEIEKVRNNFDQSKEMLRQKHQQNSKITEEVAKIEARKTTLHEVISREKTNMDNIISQKEQLTEDIKRIESLIGDMEYKKKSNVEQNEEDFNDIKELEIQKKTQMASIGEYENEKGEIIRKLKDLKIEQKTLAVKIEQLKNTVGEQKQTEERLKERVNNISIRLEEDMDIKLEEALKNYKQDSIDDKEIIVLKAKLSKIGEVNLEAPKEYEKEYERFEFIKRHVDDLEEADTDLKSIIRKINRQTKDKFLDTFNEINENFKKIFKKLFEGGKAQLRLIDPDNILESGIEIEAQPEGKNVTSIIQFSGGESALCAIALMFAIYEVKPTPFCILDEVDSPLDDANLNRFLRMLRDYINTTQFIIVTHNKQTMEMSDTFYGITMEEFGVSKTISVKIKDTRQAAVS